MSENRVLTTGQIAGYCGVNFRTVIRWIERGHLKAYKLPGRGDNRVPLQEFLGFLRTHGIPIPGEFQDRSSPRVLVVDDDASAASAIRRVLRRAGLDTMIASDGFVAGALLESFSPDLMTLDLMMPGVHGMEVLRFVRGADHLKHTKIVVVSAMPGEELVRALEAGADDVLQKPFDNRELLVKVCGLVGMHLTEEAERAS